MFFILCPPNNFIGSSPHKNRKEVKQGLSLQKTLLMMGEIDPVQPLKDREDLMKISCLSTAFASFSSYHMGPEAKRAMRLKTHS